MIKTTTDMWCDRCGKTLVPHRQSTYVTITLTNAPERLQDRFDFCESCKNEVFDFLKEITKNMRKGEYV